jgi:hypothetical protein
VNRIITREPTMVNRMRDMTNLSLRVWGMIVIRAASALMRKHQKMP